MAVNIFLLPYTWTRHFAMALWCGAAGLLAWWFGLTWITQVGPSWPPEWDGPILFCTISAAVSGASLLAEGNLCRLPLWKRLSRMFLGMGISIAMTFAWYWGWHKVALAVLFTGDQEPDALDSSLVSLRYRVGVFLFAGFASAIGPMIVRKGLNWGTHLLSGAAAGLAAAAAWFAFNQAFFRDLYLGGMAMGVAWGFVFGLLAWPIPDELYAGWIRVLSGARFGRRIPVDARDGSARERFVGHFPRGLDLFVPLDEGVLELHLSVAVDDKHVYKARGLSLHPTVVRRFLERINLQYDPRRPAPLETKLSSGDRITLGQGAQSADLEFLMLPKEEQ